MPHTHTRLVDEVGRTLEEEILSGELRPGDRLTVVPLAQRFATSQSTIREALLMLERRGLVNSNPRRGVSVTRLSEQEAVELCRMRALIEAYAVTVGIAWVTDDLLAALAGLIQEMERCELPRSLPRVIQMDLAFHRRIAGLAASETLLEVWANLNGRIGALMMRSVEANQLTAADVVSYHAEVVKALATRNPRACRLAIINHYLPESERKAADSAALVAAVEALSLPAGA
jgi:DNA-binding GntR family transcriptional regulator